jgi:hypothetical protein
MRVLGLSLLLVLVNRILNTLEPRPTHVLSEINNVICKDEASCEYSLWCDWDISEKIYIEIEVSG